MRQWSKVKVSWAYLKMKMNSTKREKNMATLSIVRSITNSCLRRFGIKRTSFKILNKRKVLSTLKPELPLLSSIKDWHSSTTLDANNLK